MRFLVVAEHLDGMIKQASRSAIAFAGSLADRLGGELSILLVGSALDDAASDAAKYAPVLLADSDALSVPTADRYAHLIAEVVREQAFDFLIAASTSHAKDVVGRAAGRLGGSMASDVTAFAIVDGELRLERPMFAGAVTATVVLEGSARIITIRPSAFSPAEPSGSSHAIRAVAIDSADLPGQIRVENCETKRSARPDVTDASVVVSGGRAFKTSEDFERLVGGLADVLGGAAGSSRALVDAAITPNELQVGQTGKIVAPDLYIALGISGAVQHLAGMKNSKTIVAINNDPDAPIFDVADFGLVADVYEAVPKMIRQLQERTSVHAD